MKVTVKDKYLNVRVDAPSLNAQINNILAPGTEIEVDGQLYKGDTFNGINTWLRDMSGNHIWSGAVTVGNEEDQLKIINDLNKPKFNYNEIINLPEVVKNSKGEGVTIAIIDTGCFDHNSLKGVIINSYNVFLKKEGIYKDNSLNGHGTFISGMISARNINNSEIVGIAPLTTIISVKAIEDDEVYAKNILDGLNWLLGLSNEKLPQIINLSLDFDPGELLDEFTAAFKAISNKGIAIIAAAQNEQNIYGPDIFYPARSGLVIGIGALKKEDILHEPLNQFISYIVPNLSFYSTTNFNNSYSNLSQCSISTAIVSAVFALFLSYKEKNKIISDLGALVDNQITQYNPNNFDNSLKIYKK